MTDKLLPTLKFSETQSSVSGKYQPCGPELQGPLCQMGVGPPYLINISSIEEKRSGASIYF